MTRRLPATAKFFAAALSTAALGLTAAPAHASSHGADEAEETIQLTGIIRDFEVDHPDFEAFPGTYNKVLDQLGSDGKPRLDLDYLSWSHSKGKQSVTSEATFAEWFNDTPNVNLTMPHTIELQPHSSKENVFWFAREKQMSGDQKYFFPIDDLGYGKSYAKNGHRLRWAREGKHNFHFTFELDTEFTYTNPSTRDYDLEFKFTGDDDVWVFVNGHLVIDLGGVHSQKSASVNIDDIAEDLGLQHLGTYQLKVFFAERHTSESNFRIETTMKLKEVPPTVVSPLFD
ncbi:MAG: fibro-slime domain-containing protein [Planctomycetota bacterium]